MSQYKTKISELPLITAADSTTIIPVSTGAPLATKKIKVDDLIKNTATIASKANLAGGNSFTGAQTFSDLAIFSGGIHAIDTLRVDTSILNIEPTGDGIWSDDVHVMTRAELLYLTGLTSNVQSQINSKAGLSANNLFTGTYNTFTSGITTMNGGLILGSDVDGKLVLSREDNLKVRADLGELSLIGDNGVYIIGDTVIAGSLNLGSVTSIYIGSNTISSTELAALDGVTSAIQTQLGGKANLAGGNTFSGSQTFSSGITALTLDAVAISSSTVNIEPGGSISYNSESAIIGDQLLYLSGLTSNIQAQINSKAGLSSNNVFSGSQTMNGVAIFNAGVSISNLSSITADIVVGNTNEIRIYDGVSNEIVGWSDVQMLQGISNNIQEQLDEKVTRLYKSYSCFLNQTGTTAPEPLEGTVINDFSNQFSWSYISEGTYRITALTGEPFTSGKTILLQNGSIYSTPEASSLSINGTRVSSGVFSLVCGDPSTGLPLNGAIDSIFIEIRVYN